MRLFAFFFVFHHPNISDTTLVKCHSYLSPLPAEVQKFNQRDEEQRIKRESKVASSNASDCIVEWRKYSSKSFTKISFRLPA